MGRVSDERAEELAALVAKNQLPWRYTAATLDPMGDVIPEWQHDQDKLSVAAVNALPDLLADRADRERELTLLRAELAYARQAMTADQQWITTTYRHWLEDERCVASLEHKVTEARKVAERYMQHTYTACAAEAFIEALNSEPVSQDGPTEGDGK